MSLISVSSSATEKRRFTLELYSKIEKKPKIAPTPLFEKTFYKDVRMVAFAYLSPEELAVIKICNSFFYLVSTEYIWDTLRRNKLSAKELENITFFFKEKDCVSKPYWEYFIK